MMRPIGLIVATVLVLAGSVAPAGAGQSPARPGPAPSSIPPPVRANAEVGVDDPAEAKAPAARPPLLPSADDLRGLRSVALIGLISMAPAVVLMFTAFVRINIVLLLLRQALGSPQVPGNQLLTALAVLLTALVMKPVGVAVYDRAIVPYAEQRIGPEQAWEAGSRPIKQFMVEQIRRTHHVAYLWDLYDLAEPPRPGRVEPAYEDEFPIRVVAPAFLLSELTTALKIGFMITLPFLVVDLVVAAVLSASGLFMLPPALVAVPLKLILFVLADGWMLVASALVQSFAV